MKLIRFLSCLCVIFLSYSSTSYSLELNINNGTLFGASNLDVNGILYDVTFIDGACSDLYSGCDDKSDFLFSNPANDGTLLGSAMQALLDQVFIDSSLGAFDSQPSLTNGCVVSGGCNVGSPLFRTGGGIGVITAFNSDKITNTQQGSLDHLTAGSFIGDFDSTAPSFSPNTDQTVYAVWSQSSVSEVPVPAAVWLFSSGLIGLIGTRKKSSKISTFST